jgi:hypothetical protein
MNTKLLMIASALSMAICGVSLQFFPHEILSYFGAAATGVTPLFFQLAGALYLGFAMTNWMAKSVLIGGIYARPLAVGNFAHFMVGALALLKYAFSAPQSSLPVWIAAVIYSLFAVLFGYVFFTHPLKTNKGDGN